MEQIKKITMVLIILVALGLTFALSTQPNSKHNGEIVKDQHGKYYKLENNSLINNETYKLIEVDTTQFSKF